MGMLVNLSDNLITFWISTNPLLFQSLFYFIYFILLALPEEYKKRNKNKQTKKNTEDMQTLVIRT